VFASPTPLTFLIIFAYVLALLLLIGVGLNVTNKHPTTCLSELVPGKDVSREEVLARFFNNLEPIMDDFSLKGFDPFKDEYLRSWLHTDQKVTIEDKEAGTSIPVTIKGLTASGYLLAEDGTGLAMELFPDGNSLDFFTGLIRRK
jgi:biotin--protein ligase